MSCPRAASSSSVGTAKSGVPMKIRRSDIIRPGVDRLSWRRLARPSTTLLLYLSKNVDVRHIDVRKHAVLWTAMAGHDAHEQVSRCDAKAPDPRPAAWRPRSSLPLSCTCALTSRRV